MGELKLENQTYTMSEYLAIEQDSENRYEYMYGYLFPVAGTTAIHNDIVFNVKANIKKQLKNRDCKAYSESLKLEVIPDILYYYPDVLLTCSLLDLRDGVLMRNPSLLVEVLSDSTEKRDLGEKLDYYTQISSLKYYLIISQKEKKVRVYEKIEKTWVFALYTDIDDTIFLPQVELELAMSEIYEGI